MPEADATAVLDGGIDEPAPSRKRRRIVLLAAGAIGLLIVAGGAGAYFTGILDELTGEGEHAADTAEAVSEAPKEPVLYDLPEFIVNLNVPGRKARFLKLRSRLELMDPADIAVVQSAMPRIVDTFQVYLRELRPEDLKGSAGTYRLREALVRRVGAEIGPERVSDLLFVELFIQ